MFECGNSDLKEPYCPSGQNFHTSPAFGGRNVTDKLKRIQMILSEVVTYEVIKLMVWTDIKVTECPGDCDQLLKLFIDKIMMMILPSPWIVCHLPP